MKKLCSIEGLKNISALILIYLKINDSWAFGYIGHTFLQLTSKLQIKMELLCHQLLVQLPRPDLPCPLGNWVPCLWLLQNCPMFVTLVELVFLDFDATASANLGRFYKKRTMTLLVQRQRYVVGDAIYYIKRAHFMMMHGRDVLAPDVSTRNNYIS